LFLQSQEHCVISVLIYRYRYNYFI